MGSLAVKCFVDNEHQLENDSMRDRELVKLLEDYIHWPHHILLLRLSLLQPVQTEVADHRPIILEVVHNAEQFLRDHRDRLSPDQQNKLKVMTNDLRGNYEQVSVKSNDWLKDAQVLMDTLKSQEDQQVSLVPRIFEFYFTIMGIAVNGRIALSRRNLSFVNAPPALLRITTTYERYLLKMYISTRQCFKFLL